MQLLMSIRRYPWLKNGEHNNKFPSKGAKKKDKLRESSTIYRIFGMKALKLNA